MVDFLMISGKSTAHEHGPQLQWGHRPRQSHWRQPGPWTSTQTLAAVGPWTQTWSSVAARPMTLTWLQSVAQTVNIHLDVDFLHSLGQKHRPQTPAWPPVVSLTMVVCLGGLIQKVNRTTSQVSAVVQNQDSPASSVFNLPKRQASGHNWFTNPACSTSALSDTHH